jgi:hypothetical protein
LRGPDEDALVLPLPERGSGPRILVQGVVIAGFVASQDEPNDVVRARGVQSTPLIWPDDIVGGGRDQLQRSDPLRIEQETDER